MKGGRLKIVNESRYPTDEVEALVRIALADIDVKGRKLLALVQNNRSRPTRGWGGAAWRFSGRTFLLGREHRADLIAQVMLGRPEQFPAKPYTRYGIEIRFATWQEALVGVMSHEGMHCQHAYDGAYQVRNGVRRRRKGGPKVQRYRVGANRVEHKCRAFEYHVLEAYRDAMTQSLCQAVSLASTAPTARH